MAEQLARNGVGSLVLVDSDRVELVNLNRIINSRQIDAELKRPKVEVQARAIRSMGFGTDVQTIPHDLQDLRAVRALSECDVVFGCMDTIEGRHLLNRLASYYLVPYFDVGVRLDTDGKGGIEQICGAVHYVKPGGSSLLSRKTYSLEQLRSEALARTDPARYHEEQLAGYLAAVGESRPAVISINFFAASMVVNEFLARLHPFRLEPNREFAVQRFSLSAAEIIREAEGEPCAMFARHVGKGDVDPPLGLPSLSAYERAA